MREWWQTFHGEEQWTRHGCTGMQRKRGKGERSERIGRVSCCVCVCLSACPLVVVGYLPLLLITLRFKQSTFCMSMYSQLWPGDCACVFVLWMVVLRVRAGTTKRRACFQAWGHWRVNNPRRVNKCCFVIVSTLHSKIQTVCWLACWCE